MAQFALLDVLFGVAQVTLLDVLFGVAQVALLAVFLGLAQAEITALLDVFFAVAPHRSPSWMCSSVWLRLLSWKCCWMWCCCPFLDADPLPLFLLFLASSLV